MRLLRVLSISFLAIMLSWTNGFSQPLSQAQSDTDRLLAQNYRSFNPERSSEDPDLEDDETLEDLMKIEYDKDAWSTSTAIGLSLVPGGGFGLIYARKKPQAVIPFLLSTVGYGLGIAYMAGAFDESQTSICTHVRAGRVPAVECSYADRPFDPAAPNEISNTSVDMRDPNGRSYDQTVGDYASSTAGRNYSGRNTGITLLAATYIVTSTLGAVWSGMSVRAHNRQLRRDIESTAENGDSEPSAVSLSELSPVLEVNSQRSTLGFRLSF